MSKEKFINVPWSPDSTLKTDWTIHQIAPYIGRMKTSIARYFIDNLTDPGDTVVDPFCGCGVVPVEAAYSGRLAFGCDWNPYGVLLTRAKLFPPKKLETALDRFENVWDLARREHLKQDLRSVPSWIREFFHPETLREALAFRDACVDQNDDFLLACLLGILHHQRPGFLSYPSSHLVPYLRSKKFPRDICSELYEFRDVRSRMLAKINRTYRRYPTAKPARRRVVYRDSRSYRPHGDIAAVITSPPYMNELDYVRDNRLRLWFIERQLPKIKDLSAKDRESEFRSLVTQVMVNLIPNLKSGGHVVLLLGDVSRGRASAHPAEIVKNMFQSEDQLSSVSLKSELHDVIPDIRRSRREKRGTKAETILVYRRI